MNGNNFLLDTNIVLYLINGNNDLISFLDGQNLILSIITEIELLGFASITKKELTALTSFIDEMEVVPVNDKIKSTVVALRKKYKLKLPDSIIAATAIVYGIPLITSDKQFRTVKELNLLLYENTK